MSTGASAGRRAEHSSAAHTHDHRPSAAAPAAPPRGSVASSAPRLTRASAASSRPSASAALMWGGTAVDGLNGAAHASAVHRDAAGTSIHQGHSLPKPTCPPPSRGSSDEM
eukprot:241699-Chlamydomonas_euryale.AAC.2